MKGNGRKEPACYLQEIITMNVHKNAIKSIEYSLDTLSMSPNQNSFLQKMSL
jgi:hypothetical protein